jgi:hypothetical protein
MSVFSRLSLDEMRKESDRLDDRLAAAMSRRRRVCASLKDKTVARGCTPGEAAAAKAKLKAMVRGE